MSANFRAVFVAMCTIQEYCDNFEETISSSMLHELANYYAAVLNRSVIEICSKVIWLSCVLLYAVEIQISRFY